MCAKIRTLSPRDLPKAFVRLNALRLCSIFPKVHLLLQFTKNLHAGIRD